MTPRLFLACALLLVAPAWAQEQAQPAQPKVIEGALVAVARHLSDPYALYLYESLTRQTLSNESLLERPGSPYALLAKDTLWAQGVVSKSILVERPDGPSLDIRLVPAFFEGIAHRYMNASHYWPDREITKETRREHLAAWYAMYLMLLVANETQDKIAATLRNSAFERDPGMLETGGPSLADKLKRERVLSEDAYQAVHIKRAGPDGAESLTFPAYMNRWEAGIRKAYDITLAP
ncbi:MAG: hypothetical protein Q7R68_08105 [Nitrospirales bacterium]|nr:hypothetical protein [Nitrospirales bacterium]